MLARDVSTMKMLLVCALLLCLSMARGDMNTSQEDKGKLVINRIPELPASITKPGMLSSGVWLILFYTPWCTHSEDALPHFVAAVQHIVDHNITQLSIGKIDISKAPGLGQQLNIRTTPTISLYRQGYRHNYDGDVDSPYLISWIVRIATANVTAVESREELEALKNNHDVLFMLVYDGKVDSDWHKTYSKVSRELALRGTFLYTLDPEILESPPSKLPALLALKDGGTQRYGGSLASHALYKWILNERHCALPTATLATLRSFIASSPKRLVILAVDKDASNRRVAQRKALEAVKKLAASRKFHSSYQFVLTEGLEVVERLMRRAVDGYPQLMVYNVRTAYYTLYRHGDKGFAESAIIEFINLVENAKLPLEGGPTLVERVQHFYKLAYSMIRGTLTHHPYVGAIAVFSLMGVIVFYIVLACQKFTKRTKVTRPSRVQARARALAHRHDNTTLRHRQNHHHSDSDDQSESESEEEDLKDK